jgi:hypothetical protein
MDTSTFRKTGGFARVKADVNRLMQAVIET